MSFASHYKPSVLRFLNPASNDHPLKQAKTAPLDQGGSYRGVLAEYDRAGSPPATTISPCLRGERGNARLALSVTRNEVHTVPLLLELALSPVNGGRPLKLI